MFNKYVNKVCLEKIKMLISCLKLSLCVSIKPYYFFKKNKIVIKLIKIRLKK